MGTIIPFPLLKQRQDLNSPPEISQPIPGHKQEEDYSSFSLDENKCLKFKEIEDELQVYFDESILKSYCKYDISDKCVQESDEDSLPDVSHLEKLVVFSPEIQQEGFAKSDSEKGGLRPSRWGDVFIRSGDEYPFLFTVYTADYVKEQFRQYGERIKPSSRDVILNSRRLGQEDIIRAVIKWVNLHCPSLKGNPIFLEDDAILQTLICDPGIEITLPELT